MSGLLYGLLLPLSPELNFAVMFDLSPTKKSTENQRTWGKCRWSQ